MIRDGTFIDTGTEDESVSVVSADEVGFISDETFSTEPDSKYIASGYVAVENASAGT